MERKAQLRGGAWLLNRDAFGARHLKRVDLASADTMTDAERKN